MAKIVESTITIRVSKLVKSDSTLDNDITSDLKPALEQIVQELVSSDCVVEVE